MLEGFLRMDMVKVSTPEYPVTIRSKATRQPTNQTKEQTNPNAAADRLHARAPCGVRACVPAWVRARACERRAWVCLALQWIKILGDHDLLPPILGSWKSLFLQKFEGQV